MKITKSRLKEIIREEIKDFKIEQKLRKKIREYTSSVSSAGRTILKKGEIGRDYASALSSEKTATTNYTTAQKSSAAANNALVKHDNSKPVTGGATTSAPGVRDGVDAAYVSTNSRTRARIYSNSNTTARPALYGAWAKNPSFVSWNNARTSKVADVNSARRTEKSAKALFDARTKDAKKARARNFELQNTPIQLPVTAVPPVPTGGGGAGAAPGQGKGRGKGKGKGKGKGDEE
tara:strand:+ start:377 stop:1078 length:702 start_codon:yes stop_codon:yes gene_type:complete